jgi:hypothetical protein
MVSEPNARCGGCQSVLPELLKHGEPQSITLDAFNPTHAALHRMGMRIPFNFRWANPVLPDRG